MTPEAQQFLMGRSWKGNVRELRRRSKTWSSSRRSDARADSLPDDLKPAGEVVGGGMGNLVGHQIEQAEKELIRNTLKIRWQPRSRHEIAGIGERTLYRKIKEYGSANTNTGAIDECCTPYRSRLRHPSPQSGSTLVVGGVMVAHDIGVVAHSDGDVAIHALVDAILGALGAGDIGRCSIVRSQWKNTQPDFSGWGDGQVRQAGYAIGM